MVIWLFDDEVLLCILTRHKICTMMYCNFPSIATVTEDEMMCTDGAHLPNLVKMIQVDDHFIGMYLVHIYVTRLEKSGLDTHEIKLMILPEMDCWLIALVYSTLCRAIIVFHKSSFFGSLFQATCINKP